MRWIDLRIGDCVYTKQGEPQEVILVINYHFGLNFEIKLILACLITSKVYHVTRGKWEIIPLRYNIIKKHNNELRV